MARPPVIGSARRPRSTAGHRAPSACSFAALVVVALFGLPESTGAQEPVRSIELTEREFTEELLPRRQVTGAARAGVLMGPLVSSVEPSQLVLRIPPGAEGLLCVNIRSANGEYLGRIQRSVDGLAPGDYRVAVPTAQARFFRSHDANEIAVLAFIAESCLGAAPRMILPASWSGAIEEDGFWVFLLLTGRHRASVVVTDADGGRETFPCETAPVRRAVSYSHRCRVTVTPGGVHEAWVDVRAGLRDQLPPISLPIRW